MATRIERMLAGELDNTEEEAVASPEVESSSLSHIERLLMGETDDIDSEPEVNALLITQDDHEKARLKFKAGNHSNTGENLDEKHDNRIATGRSRGDATRQYMEQDRKALADRTGVYLDDTDFPEGSLEQHGKKYYDRVRPHIRGAQIAWASGELAIEVGRLGWKDRMGTLTPEEMTRLEMLEKRQAGLGEELRNSPKVVSAVGQFAPFIKNSLIQHGKGGITGAITGGTLALIAGNLIPGFQLLPEEALTVPAGTKVGFAIGGMFGSTSDIGDIEGGSAYREMKSMGMEESKAKVVADFINTGSASLEIFGMGPILRLVPGLKKSLTLITKNAITQEIAKSAALRAAAGYGKNIAQETLVESSQQLWNNIAQTIAKKIRPELDKTDMSAKSKEEIVDRVFKDVYETAETTFIAMSVMGLPAGAVNISKAAAQDKTHTVGTPSGKDGTTVIVNETSEDVDVREESPSDNSVDSLLGVEGEEETTPDGVSVSFEQNITDEQRTMQHQSTESTKQVLTELAGEKEMIKVSSQLEEAEARLDNLVGFYNDSIVDEDIQATLQFSNMMDKETSTITDSYDRLLKISATRADNKNTMQDEDKVLSVQQEVARLNKESKDRLASATTAVQQQQKTEQQEFINQMNTTKGLNNELITAATQATRNGKSTTAKLYNNIVTEMKLRETVGPNEYFRTTSMKKLVDLKVQATLNDEAVKGDPNQGDIMALARNQAVHSWIDRQMTDRSEYDAVQLVGERVSHDAKVAKKEQAEAAAAAQKAEAKPAVKAVERRKKNVTTGQKIREERRLAGVAKKAKEAKAVVSDQATKIRKPVAGPTRTAELKEAKEDKASRVAAVERQLQRNKDLKDKPDVTTEAGAKSILPKGVEFDAFGDGETAMPKGHIAATIKDKKRMAHGSSIVVDPNKPVKPQLNKKEVQFTTFPNLKRDDTTWTILTSDNPVSTTLAGAANTRARLILKRKLDSLGIAYKIGKSKFGNDNEVPFIIPGITKAEAKKLSDELDQSSFIFAEGKDVSFIEGTDVTTVKKSEMYVNKNSKADYTEIDGVRFTIPFFEDSILDTESMEMTGEVATKARSLFRAAAIRLPNGKIYEGITHPTIMMENQAVEDWVMSAPVSELAGATGFVQHDGTFTDRTASAKLIGKGKAKLRSEHFLDISQAKLLDQRADNYEQISIVDFDKMPIGERLGTLEIVDKLKVAMTTGKYSFLFDKTKADGVETIFITQPGQFGKMEQVVRTHGNSKSIADAVKRFDGDVQINQKTGKMEATGGTLGLYIESQNVAIINLPLIGKSAKTIDKVLETVTHEHVHALIKKAVKGFSKAEVSAYLTELKAIWNGIDSDWLELQSLNPDVHPRVKAGIHQVNTSVNELVTYSLAHPEFATWLSKIPAAPRSKAKTSKIKTIWDALTNLIVAKVLKTPSKHDQVVDVLNNYLKFGEKDIRFSKTIDTDFDFGANVDKEVMEGWADEIGTQALNSMPVTVAADKAEAEKILGFELEDNVNAVWTPAGDMVMIADRFDSKDKFVSVWMHEQVAHQGLRNVFGKNTALFNRFLDQAYTLFSIKEAENLFKMAEIHKLGKVNKNGDITYNLAERRLMAEEVIARKAESMKPITKKGLITRFKAFIKTWLPAKFVGEFAGGKSLVLSNKDIMGMLSVARENVFTGTNKFGEMLDKALDKRAPKVKSLPGKTMPKFMETDETYIKWAQETLDAAPELKKWYSQHVETISENFGPDADLFNVLLAVTSPQADVETNVLFAIKSYAYMLGLTDKPGALFPNKLQARIDNNWKTPKDMLADLESKNFKVTEFGRALLGDPMATVGDMWMYRLFYGDPTTINKQAENFSIPQITGLREKLSSLAAQMSAKTDTTWTPREMQAALWVNINAKQTGKSIKMVASYQTGLNKPSPTLGGKSPLQWLNNLVPNLNKGPLSDAIGIADIPLAPISPLQKKLIHQVSKDVVGKYPVSTKGVIKVLSPGVDNASTAKMIKAIVAGGREVTAQTEEMAKWYQKVFGFETVDDSLHMRLSDRALELYTSDKGKVKFNLIRDNLSGFSGNYTMAVRFSKSAHESLDSMTQLDSVEDDRKFLDTGAERQSHINKIHVWKDQAELNINRLFSQLEQEFLELFEGRKSRIKAVGTGRYLHTAKSEVIAKAMNLYIDSGTGAKLDKVIAFQNKLARKPKRTARESEKLRVIDAMLSLSADAKAWANEHVRPQYEQFFNFAQKHDILDTHIEDYVKRAWVMPQEYKDAGITWNGVGTTGFKLSPSSGKQRSLDSIIDGWEAGLELKMEGVLSNVQAYAQEIGAVYANRRFVDYMRSFIGPSGESSIMVVRDKSQNPPEGFVKVTTRGFAAPGKVVYARRDMGVMLNKQFKEASAFWDTPLMEVTRKVNSMLKSTILSVTMFHHLAGLRSYVFGVRGTGLQRMRPFKAYREGLKLIDEQTGFKNTDYQHLGPIVRLLVGQGLTLGKVQDWEEGGLMNSTLEQILRNSTKPGAETALHGWQGARRWKRQWTNGLFGQLFAGLKAQSAAVELTREINHMEKKLGRGLTEEEVNFEAEKVARLINADYGGLHLGRMGRNKDYQRVAQMLLLAPDWTESNWRTVTGMAPGNIVNKAIGKAIGDNPGPVGMQKVYRKFWWGVAWKGALTVLAAQFAVLALFGDEEDRKEYLKQIGEATTPEGFAKGRWASIDITPIIKTFGGSVPRGKRTDVNVLGHFKDILKITDPVTLAKHKLSPVTRLVESMATRTDWKGDRFRTVGEMWQHGSYQLIADDYNDPKYVHGWGAGASQLFAASLYNVRSSFPIPLSEVAQAMAGETSWLSSLSRAGGVDVRDVRHADANEQFYWEKSQEIQSLERNLTEAQSVRDNRMITEARGAIRRYDNFNRTKSRLGFARTRLSPINKKIRGLEAKDEAHGLTESEGQKLKQLKKRKADIYSRFADVLTR